MRTWSVFADLVTNLKNVHVGSSIRQLGGLLECPDHLGTSVPDWAADFPSGTDLH